MNKFIKLFAFLLIIILQVLMVSPLYKEVKAQQAVSKHREKTSLYSYLHDIGDRYNCFFTIEEGWSWTARETSNNLKSYYIEDFAIDADTQQKKKLDLSLVLDELRQSLPNFVFEINQQKPHIIHIIDIRLKDQKHYGLDSLLVNFSFKGDVERLLKAINKEERLVVPKTAFSTHEIVYQDSISEVKVDGTNLSVRDALSNFISLKGRSRVLWIASTCVDKHNTTTVYFVGVPKNENSE